MTRPPGRRFCRSIGGIALALLFSAAGPASATIRYQINLEDRQKHIFTVDITIPNAPAGTQVALPAWDALYQIRDFSSRVREVQAWSSHGGASAIQTLPVTLLNKQTWQLGVPQAIVAGEPNPDILVRYTIQWDDPGPFSSQLNNHHAFLNLAQVLMYIPDRRSEDTLVLLTGMPDGWKTIAALTTGPATNSFTAESYDTLVDAPIEAGKVDQFGFDSGATHIRVVVDSQDYRKGTLENALKRITAYQLKLMEGPALKEYTFIFHIGPYAETGSGGGMEHMNSTAIATGSLESAIGVAAHEFFHAWNVKRIRPQALEPVDFTKEQYTRALWFAEGVTSTYQNYTLVRVGHWSKEAFLADLADQVCDLQARPARLWQSAEESSVDAWFEKYDFYNRPDRSVWYYNKGQILGVLLDLKIREGTDNRKSLDDVFRLMNQKYAAQGRFYDDRTDIRAAVEEVAGESFQDFFQAYVSGTREIPYDSFFDAAGLNLRMEQMSSGDLGFWPNRTLGGMVVAAVESGSAAEAAGVKEGDVLIELDGEPFPHKFTAWLSKQSPGQKVKLRVRRDGEEKGFIFALGAHSDRHCSIASIPQPTEKQRRIRDGILQGTTDTPSK